MKKLLFILGLFVFFMRVGSAQWVSNYGGHSYGDNNFSSAKGLADAVDIYGNCVVTGYCYDEITGDDIITIKYSPLGDTLWTRTYNGSGNSEDRAFGIACDAVGNIYVTGYASNYGAGTDVVLIKYSPDGIQLWDVIYNGTGNDEDKAFGIAVDALGGINITGYCTNASGNNDIVTIKYSTYGTLLWAEVFNGSDNMNDRAFGIAIDNLGNILVTGYSMSQANGKDIITIKYNTLGQQLWAARYDKSHLEDQPSCIATDALGNVYVAGYVTPGTDNTDCILLKYNSLGQLQWAKTYSTGGGGTEDKAFGIVVDAVTGSIYITGEAGLDSNTNYVTIKYSSSGSRIWVSSYSGTGGGDDQATAIALVDGNVVVTGSTEGTTNTADYTTIEYSSTTGTQLEISTYSMDSSSEDVATDLAVSSTGDVYVTGYSELLIEAPVTPSVISTLMLNWGESTKMKTLSNSPNNYTLHQNYPNPFNPSTTIKIDVLKPGVVKLAVYDMLGREVTTLVNEFMSAGSYEVVFSSSKLNSGVYFYVLTAGDFKDVKKMTLIK